MNDGGFEFLEHTADVKARAYGPSLEIAYSQAAYALMATITPDLSKISKKHEKKFTITAEDQEALLFDFLSELLYIFDVDHLVFGDISVESIKEKGEGYELRTILIGEEFDKEKHEIGTEVKAITYSYMKIEEKEDLWNIEVVFDI
jgi:SHS2 domain-containing protein